MTDLELAERLNGVRLALLDRGVTSAHPDYIACEQAAAALREAHAEIERLSLADAEDVAEVERLKSELTSTQADARTLSAEVERLRGLLVLSRPWLEGHDLPTLCARIDAALAGEKP